MELKEWRQGEAESDGESRGEEFGYRDDVGDGEGGWRDPVQAEEKGRKGGRREDI